MRADVRYSEALAETILLRLANGETLKQVCEDDGMPVESAVRQWANNLDHPFSARYARARELGWLRMADELIDIADDGRNDWIEKKVKGGTIRTVDEECVKRSQLRLDTRKWLLSKALPKIYGDKLEVQQKIGFSEEFERFVRELKGMEPPKVVNGLARSGGALEVQPVELRAGSDLQADRGDLAPVDTGNTKA